MRALRYLGVVTTYYVNLPDKEAQRFEAGFSLLRISPFIGRLVKCRFNWERRAQESREPGIGFRRNCAVRMRKRHEPSLIH
jgi:hypothetical protein